ncbi:HEAT repeat domain-containing protein [Archangium gephyra]|uniref:HEAT repeat domain-containing protein n=1 Tax=Archangium gephyra TaxID=48 RepID=UPI0035D4164B
MPSPDLKKVLSWLARNLSPRTGEPLDIPPGIEGALFWRVERIREDTMAMAWLVLRMVMDPPGPARTAIIQRLLQVFAVDPTPAVLRAMPEQLVELLDSPEPEVRYLAARLVDARETPAAIPGLRRGLGDSDYMLRRTCLQALRSAGLPPDAVVPHLRSERLVEREAALELCGRPLPELLRRELWRLLEDPAVSVRYRAAERLGADPEAPGLCAVALDMVRTGGERSSRAYAIRLLGRLGLRTDALPVLLEALRSGEDEFVRVAAAEVLGVLAPDVTEVADALVAALKDGWDGVGIASARALASRGATTESVIPRLLAALADRKLPERTRGQVALTLAQLGVREAVPELLRQLTLPDRVLHEHECEPYQSEDMRGASTPQLKLAVMRALGELGEPARAALPALFAKARAGVMEARLEAARALVLLGTAPAEVRSLLQDLPLSGEKGEQLLELFGLLKP